jgi:vacuole morphology and inheritance protein 14
MDYCMSTFSFPTPFLSYFQPRLYLSDPTEDVRIAAENQLAEFLREIREVTIVRKHREEQERLREAKPEETIRAEVEQIRERLSDVSLSSDPERASVLNGNPPLASSSEAEKPNGDIEFNMSERDVGGRLRV